MSAPRRVGYTAGAMAAILLGPQLLQYVNFYWWSSSPSPYSRDPRPCFTQGRAFQCAKGHAARSWRPTPSSLSRRCSRGSLGKAETVAVARPHARRVARSPTKRLRSQNLPATKERLTAEPNEESFARCRGKNGFSFVVAEHGIQVVLNRLRLSDPRGRFTILRMPRGARADLIFQPTASSDRDEWVPIQVKSTSQTYSGSYLFSRVAGYRGMLLLLVAIDVEMIWALPPYAVTSKGIAAKEGGKWDMYRAESMAQSLSDAWNRARIFPRRSYSFCASPFSPSQQIELHHRGLLIRMLRESGLEAVTPLIQGGQVDLLVNGIRVQQRSTRLVKEGTGCQVHLFKSRGHGTRYPYNVKDFDVLLIHLRQGQRVTGLFMLGMDELARQGFVEEGEETMGRLKIKVYPPSSLPTCPQTVDRTEWQRRNFLDVESAFDARGKLRKEVRQKFR
eukprot:CAMPEP_0170582608 /NCGR_PEP_ID=MMETSP0224-20130122/7679_1 /TAXON_ID=285029 /ORGANISM="Togula jolla, Strain CCCM 725" /LENGTH=447 /DNA_ID=CAMNT_0010905853 /DNA_START=10 /DNA_END=1349 /DNA_ORIENTATION=+